MDEVKRDGFFGHVFNFDDASRQDLGNVAQYSVLAGVLALIITKGLDAYMPDPDPDKNIPTLALELAAQVAVTFILVVFGHRVIEFIPTMAGGKYAPLTLTTTILPTLLALFAINYGIGKKANLIWDKMFNAEPPKKPPSNQSTPLLPSGVNTSNPMQAEPDFNTMFAGPTTPLVNAASPDFEPMASNAGGMNLF